MHVRPLTDPDIPSFRTLRLQALREVPVAFGTTASEFARRSDESIAEQWRGDAAAPGNFVLGAFSDGELRGMAALYRQAQAKSRHKAELCAMYVDPAYRSHGLGRALVDGVVAGARAVTGLEQVTLSVVPEMVSARQLYRRCGFLPYGVEPRAVKYEGRYYDLEHMVLLL